MRQGLLCLSWVRMLQHSEAKRLSKIYPFPSQPKIAGGRVGGMMKPLGNWDFTIHQLFGGREKYISLCLYLSSALGLSEGITETKDISVLEAIPVSYPSSCFSN